MPTIPFCQSVGRVHKNKPIENPFTVCVNALEVAFAYHVQWGLPREGNESSHGLSFITV